MSPPDTDELSGVICCRWCRGVDRNELLFSNNHGGPHGLHWGICIAQSLTATTSPTSATSSTAPKHAGSSTTSSRPADTSPSASSALPSCGPTPRRRVRENAPPQAPEHHAVQVADQGGLW